MPPRGKAPGLKRGRVLKDGTACLYWIARQVARNTMGFPDSCIPLPRGADDEMLADLCQYHTARLLAWIAAAETMTEPPLTVTSYDGSVRSACRIYQEHPHSRFHRIKYNTRATYVSSLKVIEATVGGRLIRNLTVFDVEHWYEEWRKPAIHEDADGNQVVGAERIKRAHDAVTMFRTVLRFSAALRHPSCKQLDEELSKVKFEKAGAREQEMTYSHVVGFIRTALELGAKDVIPIAPARNMATGVAAQFELLLRQKDIIGEWPKTIMDQEKAVRRGATSKSKYRAATSTCRNILCCFRCSTRCRMKSVPAPSSRGRAAFRSDSRATASGSGRSPAPRVFRTKFGTWTAGRAGPPRRKTQGPTSMRSRPRSRTPTNGRRCGTSVNDQGRLPRLRMRGPGSGRATMSAADRRTTSEPPVRIIDER
jgi:hypothetical protein